MAVYTEVADDELAAFISLYNVGQLLSYKGIAEGVENTNYLVQTTEGSYILTLYEKRVDPDELPFFLGLMDHLAFQGIPCPITLKQTNGPTLGQLAGRPAALITFLEGMWVRRPMNHHCGELGHATASLHLAGRSFAGLRQNTLSHASWRPLFGQCRDHADSVHDGLADEIDQELQDLEGFWPTELPTGIIHADLFPDNVFFLNDRLSGIIDFYFACTDILAYDIAICLNAWCFENDGSFNITKARAFLVAYNKVRKLEPGEYEALPLLARGASMRFLLTRLYDWVNTPSDALVVPKDPIEYLRKLRFHRKVQSVSEYGIDPA